MNKINKAEPVKSLLDKLTVDDRKSIFVLDKKTFFLKVHMITKL